MKALHHALMGITFVVCVAVAVIAMQPMVAAAAAQHGHAAEARHGQAAAAQHAHAEEAQHAHEAEAQHGYDSDEAEHFHVLAEQLELSEAQQEAVAQPFQEAFAAMQKLHQMHDVIAAELTVDQREKLAHMIHEMLAASFSEQASGHDAPHH